MEPWDFGWDAIAALAGVVAVVVAALLGWLGVRLATKAVGRAKLDYIGQRADIVAAQLERLRILCRELDTALLPFWETKSKEWRGDNVPDFSPAQGKLLELQATCETVSLAVRGLTATDGRLGGSAVAEKISLALSALNISTYIQYVYFVNSGHPDTRVRLNRFYENELSIYEPEQREMVGQFLEGVKRDTRLPNTTTIVSGRALGGCSEAIENLVIQAFEIAGSDDHRSRK